MIVESKYKAPMFCSNPNIQTIVPTLFRKVKGVDYTRTRIDTPDGDFLDLDWSRVGARRVAVVLHGLEGNSSRSYVLGMVKALNNGGWDAAALNFRSCSGEPNRKLRMYHSGDTEDLQTVIEFIKESGKYEYLVLIGFSLGGNIVLKYLGERGNGVTPLIRAAAVFSVPVDLVGSSVKLREPINRFYTKRFLKLLREKVKSKAGLLPGEISDDGYEEIRNLNDFDDRYTAKIYGFRDAIDYYTQSSSLPYLLGITRPTLLVNAADDPFLSASCFPEKEAKQNPNLFLEVPQHGGHVGFIQFNSDGSYWSEKRATEFFESVLE